MPIWIFIAFVSLIMVIVGIRLQVYYDKNWLDHYEIADMMTTIGLVMTIVFGFGGAIGTILNAVAEETYDKIVYDNIYSVRGTDNELYGSFCLGSGHIDEDSYYVVYVEDDKGLKMEKFNTDITYIVEVNDNNYYVRETKEKWKLDPYYTIYVPEGTVIVEFSI